VPRRLPGGSRENLLLLVFAILVGGLGPGESRAQNLSASPDTVAAIHVTGNTTVDDELVRRGFGVAVGSRYSLDAVRKGIRRLHELNFFSDIIVEGEPGRGSVTLTIRVAENPKVGSVEFSGNKKIKEDDLLKVTGFIRNKMADEKLLAEVERSISHAYHEKGYTRAQVTPRYLPGDSESRRILLIEVAEGPKMRVEKIRFHGNSRLSEGNLRGPMKQGTTGFLKGGQYKPDVLADDMKLIEAEMAKKGFRDGKVLRYEVVPGSKEDRLVVEVYVEEGPLYYFGSVKWEGNEVLPSPALYALTRVRPGTVFNQENIERTVEHAYEAYANRGYIYLNIQPDFASADSVVDLTLRVIEGEPSHIHDVIITGNTRTKERVIRRQLVVRPGDLFSRNALVRSNNELQQLGFFSDVQVKSNPVPGSSDIDLILELTEKQVGTASAGFGFSSSVGLTGFMELGHTNLFGNGQRLNLRLERGKNRNNANISVTEPWFRGTPTSVGLDLFTTNSLLRGPDLDLNVWRAGGAIRLGRPLPLAYTRIFATYRLENQRVLDEPRGTPTVGRSFTTGFRLDQETSLSSSLAFTLTRNSTNHPIYPTGGSNGRFRMEFSGGPLGGDQVFQKYELDLSRYLKTMNMGNWKPILMVRGRLGAVGEFQRDDSLKPIELEAEEEIAGAVWDSIQVGATTKVLAPVPYHLVKFPTESSELFRLGGTTFNALRGYDDFEIVPHNNVSERFDVVETVQTVDSLDTKIYRVFPGRVFYPGGKYMMVFNFEWQFSVADPLHALIFFDVGGTWNEVSDFRMDSLHKGLGIGVRMEVPLLGLLGFDYGYGFDRLNRLTGRYNLSGWEPHIQFGTVF
jgi:outer membrane protein insertion porin family